MCAVTASTLNTIFMPAGGDILPQPHDLQRDAKCLYYLKRKKNHTVTAKSLKGEHVQKWPLFKKKKKKRREHKTRIHHADICLMNTKVEDRKCPHKSSDKINKHHFLPNVRTQKKHLSSQTETGTDTESRKSESK